MFLSHLSSRTPANLCLSCSFHAYSCLARALLAASPLSVRRLHVAITALVTLLIGFANEFCGIRFAALWIAFPDFGHNAIRIAPSREREHRRIAFPAFRHNAIRWIAFPDFRHNAIPLD